MGAAGVGRILVVDNDTLVADLVALLLRRRGHAVTVRSDVASALAFIGSNLVDIVVSDLRMKGQDGDVLVAALRDDLDAPPVVMMTAESELEVLEQLVRDGIHGLVIKPFEPSLLICTVEIAMRKSAEMRGLRSALRSGGATGTGQWFASRNKEALLVSAMESQRTVYEAHALSVASGIEGGVANGSMHGDRFARFAVTIAASAGCTPSEVEGIRRASPWHDIGMIEMVGAMRTERGRWSDEEVARMRGHCEAGAMRLSRGGALVDDSAVRMARSHHERWDGGGYPHGLQGEEIPLEGRVAAIADALDAMTARRSYRARLGWEEAMSQLRLEAGSAFDPRLVEAAVRAEPELRQIAEFIEDV